jgi:glycosyltransferase involved in cell wall biosynthesis
VNPIRSILRNASRKEKEKLNILCACSHERYESSLAMTGHQFYSWRSRQEIFEDWRPEHAPIPSNYTLLPYDEPPPEWIDYDLVLSQNRFGQYQVLEPIAKQLGLPLITLEHTLAMPQWTSDDIRRLKTLRGDFNIFISKNSRAAWGWDENEAQVIYHGIDTDLFKPAPEAKKKNHILSVVKDFIERDAFVGYSLWENVTNGLPRFPVGGTPGLSEPAKNVHELVRFYNEAQIFINTSLISPIPMAVLEALSCECLVISTATGAIPEVITNGYDGFITNNTREMRHLLEHFLEHPEEGEEIRKNARKTILEKFSLDRFITEWNNIFQNVIKH